MSAKSTSRPRKHRQKDEMKQEIVAQVHKTPKKEVGSDTDNVINLQETTTNGISDSGSDTTNKTYKVEDRNDNFSVHTPSRDISVDGETQISSKILTLIETEMKRDLNKHSHFTDSRPQSLSFYEEEKMPEELSGNLELLSPEERKHYKKRKEPAQMDTDERNAYNSIQDLYAHDDEMINSASSKRSKSRKKRHGDNEHGLGDSREMMIPKEKRKSKKKKRDCSPGNGKRKHRRRDEEVEVNKGEVALALDELQDDVFEMTVEEYARQERVKRSPRRADKVYVQRKNRFEATPRTSINGNSVAVLDGTGDGFCRRLSEYRPIELASRVQRYWLPFTMLCHGLLGGLGLAHLIYLRTNYYSPDDEYLIHYASFSDLYVSLFYFLCVICLISVYDRYDLGNLDYGHLKETVKTRKSSVVILVYLACMIIHLCTAKVDDKIGLLAYDNSSVLNITKDDINEWSTLSGWRSTLAFLSWIIIGLAPGDDMLYSNLKNMEQFIPNN